MLVGKSENKQIFAFLETALLTVVRLHVRLVLLCKLPLKMMGENRADLY